MLWSKKIGSSLNPCRCGESCVEIEGWGYYWISLTGIDLDAQWDESTSARKEIKKLSDREKNLRRREREQEAEGVHTDEQILAVWYLQDGRCYYCGDPLGVPGTEKVFQKDHIIPLDAMGTHWIDNIALTCIRCNSSKSALSENSFRKELARIIGTERVDIRAKEVTDHKRLKRKLLRT